MMHNKMFLLLFFIPALKHKLIVKRTARSKLGMFYKILKNNLRPTKNKERPWVVASG